MTQTQLTPARRARHSAGQAIGQALGQAQSVLSRVLVEAVAQAGTDRETYLALQRLGVLGDAAALDRYVRDLVDWLDLDARSAGSSPTAWRRRADHGRAGTVEITADGAQLRARSSADQRRHRAAVRGAQPGRRRDHRPHPARPQHRSAGRLADGSRPRGRAHDHAEPARPERRGQARDRRRGPDDHARRARGVPARPGAAGPGGRVRGPARPGRRASVRAGWELFKRQLHLHHTAEDDIVWPALRERLPHSDHAQSVLDAMEAEHQQIDPLLAAVDGAFARADDGHRADVRAIGDAADALAALADRSPRARGARRPAAHRRGAHQRRMARGGIQDRPQERTVGGRRDVRLAGRRRGPGPGRRRDRHAPAARAAGLPRDLEAALQPNLALVRADARLRPG